MSAFRLPFTAFVFFFAIPTTVAANTLLTVGGGLNSSFTDNEGQNTEFSKRLGYNVGVGLENQPGPRFAYVLEMNLETRGQKARITVGTTTLDYELNLLYLQIPAYLMFKLPVGSGTLDVFGGPSLGIPVSGEVVFDGTSQDVTDELKSPQLGFEVGLGFEVPVGTARLFFRPSYYAAFTNMAEDDAENTKLRNFKFKAGLGFPLGG